MLYSHRSAVELGLRDLKITAGLDMLSCQTRQMNEKQFWVHLLTCNAVCLPVARATSNAGVGPRAQSP